MKRVRNRKIVLLYYHIRKSDKANEAYSLVYKYFEEKYKQPKEAFDKTELWFITENPLLGGISPLLMLQFGRDDKLLSFIECQLEGYYP